MTAGVEEEYRRMYQAAKDWDGRHAVVRLEPKTLSSQLKGHGGRLLGRASYGVPRVALWEAISS